MKGYMAINLTTLLNDERLHIAIRYTTVLKDKWYITVNHTTVLNDKNQYIAISYTKVLNHEKWYAYGNKSHNSIE